MKQLFTSKNTSINRTRVPRAFKLISWENPPPNCTPVNLDYGGGLFDTATEYLTKFGWKNLIYDPYARTTEHNTKVFAEVRKNGGADRVVVSNVLNVIKEDEIRQRLLDAVQFHLKTGAFVIFTVYQGNLTGIGKQSKNDCWQANRRLKTYLPEIEQVFGSENCEIHGGYIIAYKKQKS